MPGRRRVYHWKHGWIPLDHISAVSKAHGSESGAARIMARQRAATPAARRRGGTELQGHDALPGLEPSNRELPFNQAPRPSTPPKPAAGLDHFRMGGKELADRAAKGDKAAQAELDRRAARKTAGGKAGGHRPGVPFKPPADHTPTTPTTRPTSQPGNASKFQLTPAEKAANAAKMHGAGSDQHLAALAAENRQIEKTLPGTTIDSKLLTPSDTLRSLGLQPRVIDTQHRVVDEELGARMVRVGSVTHLPNGQYGAKLNGATIGTFPDRAEAHRALAAAYDKATADARQQAAEKAARDAKAKAANAERAKKAAAGAGSWEAFTPTGDGTRLGTRATAQVKQAFRMGDATVLIETTMSQASTKALLADIGAVMAKSKAGEMVPGGVTFRVPAGDKHFRAGRNGGMTGGYVITGLPVVHINPSVANGRAADRFGAGSRSAQLGHFMPASKSTPGVEWVLTHELGHVVDAAQGDTRNPNVRSPSGFSIPTGSREDVSQLTRQHDAQLSHYGRTNNAEAYAEAFAQWVQGGPGSNPASDAFARRFGWPTPGT